MWLRRSADSGPARTLVVFLMVGLSVMSYFDRTIMSIAGPQILNEFALSETEMGGIYSAFLFSYALLMIPGGRLADRFGPRLVLTGMALGSALFTGLTAWGGRPGFGAWLGIVPSFILVRLGLGIATAPLYPSCARMNANWSPPEQRARVWGWIAAGAGIGGAVSPILFSWMIQRYGWRTAFWMAAVATGALGIAWVSYARDYPRTRSSLLLETEAQVLSASSPAPWRALLANRGLMLLTVGYFAVCYFEYIFFYWLYYYFGQIRRMGTARTAVYTTVMWLAWVVMTPIGGWASDQITAKYGTKRGRRLVPIVCLSLSLGLLYSGISRTSDVPAVLLLCLALGFAAASDGPYWATAIELGGRHVGAACGILNTGGNLGGFLAPVLTPYVAARAGWTWGLYAGNLMLFAGILTWFFIDPTKREITAGE